jgi:prepilin-type processing-associated H-X9-DG protein
MMYMQDYDSAYPLAWYGIPGYGFDCVLQPYIKNVQVFECPSNKVTPRYWDGYVTYFHIPPPGIPGSYAMNGDLAARSNAIDRTGLTEAALQFPANTIMMTEIWDTRGPTGQKTTHTVKGYGKVNDGPQHEIFTTNKDAVCQRVPFYIHMGGSNYNFADGHAKYEKVEQTWGQWRADGIELPGNPTSCLDHTKQKGL